MWQKAIVFAEIVYDPAKGFSGLERYGLADQMRRVAASVSPNIAEGTGRDTDQEFIRFVGVAYASILKVVSQTFAPSGVTV